MDTKKRKQLVLVVMVFIGILAVSFFRKRQVVSPVSNTSGITLIFLSPTPAK